MNPMSTDGTNPHVDKLYDEIEKIAQKILMELETTSSKNFPDAHYAKTILKELESVSSGDEYVTEKKAVIKALLLSIWLQRLYFITLGSTNHEPIGS